MERRTPFLRSLSLVPALLSLGAPAQETPATPSDETVVVERGPFVAVHESTGAFDDPHAVEVAYRPEAFQGALEVVEAAAPGRVEKGQVLVRFSTEVIDERIEDAKVALRAAQVKLQRQREEAERKREAIAIEVETARLAHESAQQTFETFRDVLMPMRIAEAELGMQASEERLQEQIEQYEQLLEMYKSDDLVETTEEIVLRREKRSLEQSKARMVFTRRRHELLLQTDIPRELEGYEFRLRKATNDWELAHTTAALRFDQNANELQQAELAFARQERSLAQLQRDREALVLRAEEAGIAVPGTLARGKWSGVAEAAKLLRPGARTAANAVLLSLTQQGPRMVHTLIPEAVILDVRPGQRAIVAPVALPHARLAAQVVRVAPIGTDGKFDAWLEVAQPDARLLAGHACRITLTTFDLSNVISVPASAVAEVDGGHVVHVFAEGSFRPRPVEVGATAAGRTLIVSGLEPGESIRRRVPKEGTP